MAPTVQKAVVIQHDGSVALREVAVPKPGPDEILVKVVAAAQNPADCGYYHHIISYAIFVQNNF
jgi:NADPH:quinone reductase-like Zn-dependent oxidoreductase